MLKFRRRREGGGEEGGRGPSLVLTLNPAPLLRDLAVPPRAQHSRIGEFLWSINFLWSTPLCENVDLKKCPRRFQAAHHGPSSSRSLPVSSPPLHVVKGGAGLVQLLKRNAAARREQSGSFLTLSEQWVCAHFHFWTRSGRRWGAGRSTTTLTPADLSGRRLLSPLTGAGEGITRRRSERCPGPSEGDQARPLFSRSLRLGIQTMPSN